MLSFLYRLLFALARRYVIDASASHEQNLETHDAHDAARSPSTFRHTAHAD